MLVDLVLSSSLIRISQLKMIYKKESYDIVGTLFDVQNNLGSEFLEMVYKEAIEYEFKDKNIGFEREKEYLINY